MTGQPNAIKTYMWAIIAGGAFAAALSAYRLPVEQLDLKFAVLAVITVVVSSRLTSKIPRLSSHITVSDTFIFLTMMLYGGEAAILLAAVEGLCSSLRVNKKVSTTLFNSAVMVCATFLTVATLRVFFGSIRELSHEGYTPLFVVAVCVMALAQYVFNSGLVSVLAAYKIDRPFWHTWRNYYLWTSITYFAGASAAAIIAKLINSVGFYAVVVTTPIIAIIFFTYEAYRESLEASARQAEQAERHVEELSLYIAKREQAEQERDRLLVREQEARAEAERANRVKDEFLATLSHELRTPLTSVVGWTDLLRSERLDAETRVLALETIERSALTQVQLINELLDVSRIITGKLLLDIEQVDLATVVGAAVEVMLPAANAKGITVAQDCVPGEALITGDAGRLQQVVWNLLANAVKFTPAGGRVEVKVERSASHVVLSVSDTGVGIAPEFLPHVFERFRQADSTTTRTHGGLGPRPRHRPPPRRAARRHGPRREPRREHGHHLFRQPPAVRRAGGGEEVAEPALAPGRRGERPRGPRRRPRPRRGRRAGRAQGHQHRAHAVGGRGARLRVRRRSPGGGGAVDARRDHERHRDARRGRLRAHQEAARSAREPRGAHPRRGPHGLRARRRPRARAGRGLPEAHRQARPLGGTGRRRRRPRAGVRETPGGSNKRMSMKDGGTFGSRRFRLRRAVLPEHGDNMSGVLNAGSGRADDARGSSNVYVTGACVFSCHQHILCNHHSYEK